MADFLHTVIPKRFVLVAHVGDARFGPGPAIKALENCVCIVKAYEELYGTFPAKEDIRLIFIVNVCEEHEMAMLFPILQKRYSELSIYMEISHIYTHTPENIHQQLHKKQVIITRGFDVPLNGLEYYYTIKDYEKGSMDAIMWRKLSIFQKSRITRFLPDGSNLEVKIPPIRNIIGNDDFYHGFIKECTAGTPNINKIYLSNPAMWKPYSLIGILLTVIYTFPGSEIHVLFAGEELQNEKNKRKINLLREILLLSENQQIREIAAKLPEPENSLSVNLSQEMPNNLVVAEGIGTAEMAVIAGALLMPMIEMDYGYGLDDESSIQPMENILVLEGEEFHVPEYENQIVLRKHDEQITIYLKKGESIIEKNLDREKSELLLQLVSQRAMGVGVTTEIAILCGKTPRLVFQRYKEEIHHHKLNLLLFRLNGQDISPFKQDEEQALLSHLEGLKPQFLQQLTEKAKVMIAMRERLRTIYSSSGASDQQNPFLTDVKLLDPAIPKLKMDGP